MSHEQTPAAWASAAHRRAEQHRLSQLRVTLKHSDGQPLSQHQVRYQQVSQDFLIGTCIGKSLLADHADGERQRTVVRSHFPLVVCENAMKWYATEVEDGEESYDRADQLLAWSQQEGRVMRGHCLFWDKEKFNQPWVRALDGPSLRRRMQQRLRSILERYRGQVSDWDALNEILDGGFMTQRLGADGPAWIFREAAAIDPSLRLFTNEYGILDSDQRCERYYELISKLLEAGAPVGGIGIQEHAAERFVPDAHAALLDADRPERQGRGPLIPHEIWRRLDRLASTGLPIHITELSIASPDRERAARCMDLLLRTFYAHPAVECALFWGFEARNHWLGDQAAMIDPHGRPYPALLALSNCQREWTSHGEVTTDSNGTCTISGWHGHYQLSPEGQSSPLSCHLNPQAPPLTLTIPKP